MKITVFTPTYNRRDTLPRLYNSLLRQTSKDFEWIIVDDGSVDHTDQLVQEWIDANKLVISYHKKENGGKHRAVNAGLQLAKGELFFIVDSDDYLTDESIEFLVEKSDLLKGDIIGIAPRKGYADMQLVGGEFPDGSFVSNHIEKTYKLRLKGDLAEVVKTEVLRQYQFPDFPGEKFCAESLLWNKLANDKYKFIFDNTLIYICEYLDGGLTANSLKNRRTSPSYATLLYKELAESRDLPLNQKIRAYLNFWRFAFFTNRSILGNLKFLNYNLLGFLTLPVGIVLKINDDRKLN